MSPGMRLERRADLRSTVELYLIIPSIIPANWSCQTADNLYYSAPFKKGTAQPQLFSTEDD